MRPWSNAVLHMSRTQFNHSYTHVKFGVGWLISFGEAEVHEVFFTPSQPIFTWVKPNAYWNQTSGGARSLLFCVRFRLNKVRRLTQICVLLIIWVDLNCHKVRLMWYTAFNPGLRSTFGTQKFGSFWKPIWEPKCHQLLKFTKVYKCL